MGIFDEVIKQEQNKPDPKELERTRKQEEKEAEQRAYAEAEEKLMPYVRTALLEYPDACRKMGCENLIIFVYKKPGFFRNNEYEKWTGIPVYQSPYGGFLFFIRDGKYYANASKWDCWTGTNELYFRYPDGPLIVYPDQLPKPLEITQDEAVQRFTGNMVSWLRKKEKSGEDYTQPIVSANPDGDPLVELHLLMKKAYRAYMNQDYEQAVTLFFMHSFKQMQGRKNSRVYKLVLQY